MKKFVILTVMLLAFASLSYAGCGSCASDKSTDTKAMSAKMVDLKSTGEHATMEGTLVCLGCSLKKEDGANAACKSYGHTHALKTKDGNYISFLENKFSADLIKGEKYQNKPIQVHGLFYAKANTLDVESFSVDGQKKSWCDHCSAMDACMAQK